MTNNSNVEVIAAKMLNTLHSSTDTYFRNALVLKITALVERFAPTHDWYIQTMCLLFELGSEYLTMEVLNNFLKLVMEKCEEDPGFGEEIMGKMKELLTKVVPTDFIIKATVWVLGEIGSGTVKDAAQI
jgi:AP-4 complex subunit epsilon-1